MNLREELKSIEIGLFVYNIEKYKKDLEELVQSIDVMQNQANEHDRKNKLYYFVLYRSNLKNIFFSISEKTLKNDKEALARIKNIKERYF